MTEQHDHDETIPPPDFGPGSFFITNDEGFKVSIAGLSAEQSARVFALQQARLVLTADAQTDCVHIGGASGPHREWVKPAPAPEVMDIYNLSLFILDGIDPWQEVRAEVRPFRMRTSDPFSDVLDCGAGEDASGPDEGLPPSD